MVKSSKTFLNDDFLLDSEHSVALYHGKAASMPILDYHNHLSPKDIATNRKFNNLTEAWLEGDHYKWRAMRTHGVEEKYCTGNASPKEKFIKWAETVPFTLRNPLYHWTHLELKRYFGIDYLLNKQSAESIYEHSTQLLQQDDFRVQALLIKQNVEVVCTTDDPSDNLEYHVQMQSHPKLRMYPTFRPDKAYSFDNQQYYIQYLAQLSSSCNTDIRSLQHLLDALVSRINYFDAQGCRAADHGLEHLPYGTVSSEQASQIFDKLITGKSTDFHELQNLRAFVLLFLCERYQEKEWIQQFHLGALRNNNTRKMNQLGADSGFDSIGDFSQARSMAWFFNELDKLDRLGKTILYNLNPADNAVFASMTGNFNDGSIPGKMQYGAAWWFLDQKEGIENQINMLSNLGLLAHFVGMVTDSRSFLSFPRHEYFRRILCNLIGNDIAKGDLPDDLELIGSMVKNICYFNTKNFFRF